MPNNTTGNNKPSKINPNTKHLILCEGNDDEKFISCFLESDVFGDVDITGIQVMQVRGVDNLRRTVLTLKNAEHFSQLSTLLIIRDADNNVEDAQKSVKGIFEKAELPIPRAAHQWSDNGTMKTGFLLMPTCGSEAQTGSLDDLCWNVLSDKFGALIRDDVVGFIDSLEQSGKRTYGHKSKALLHTYFSATDKLIAANVGRASEAGAFDWHSDKLNSLKGFLISMVQKDNN